MDLLFRDVLFLIVIVLAGCHSGSESSSSTIPEQNVLIAIPTAKSQPQLLEDGTWRAFINIPQAKDLTCGVPVDADTCELSVDTSEERASARIDLAAGAYNLEVIWEYLDPTFVNPSRSDGFWPIANAQKQLTVEAGKTSSLTFSENDYEPLPDADGDGVSNLVELTNGTDPNDPNDPGRNVVVPDVVGLKEADARDEIEDAGLVVGSVTREFSEGIEVDRVISQNPARDVLVSPGTSVDLVVSRGTPPTMDVAVPDCRNIPAAGCIVLIEIAELQVGTVTREFSETIEAGNVIRTIPPGNTMVEIGSNVDIVVSKGPSDDDDDDDDD